MNQAVAFPPPLPDEEASWHCESTRRGWVYLAMSAGKTCTLVNALTWRYAGAWNWRVEPAQEQRADPVEIRARQGRQFKSGRRLPAKASGKTQPDRLVSQVLGQQAFDG